MKKVRRADEKMIFFVYTSIKTIFRWKMFLNMNFADLFRVIYKSKVKAEEESSRWVSRGIRIFLISLFDPQTQYNAQCSLKFLNWKQNRIGIRIEPDIMQKASFSSTISSYISLRNGKILN